MGRSLGRGKGGTIYVPSMISQPHGGKGLKMGHGLAWDGPRNPQGSFKVGKRSSEFGQRRKSAREAEGGDKWGLPQNSKQTPGVLIRITSSYLKLPSALTKCQEPRGSQAQSPEVTINNISKSANTLEQESQSSYHIHISKIPQGLQNTIAMICLIWLHQEGGSVSSRFSRWAR